MKKRDPVWTISDITVPRAVHWRTQDRIYSDVPAKLYDWLNPLLCQMVSMALNPIDEVVMEEIEKRLRRRHDFSRSRHI